MRDRRSVAMTSDTHGQLRAHLLREDGQEDICLATYRPSTGAKRTTAVIRDVILPLPDERSVHGNASITGEYVLRAAGIARDRGEGLVLCHSHPGGRRWQGMSGPDRDTESAYANLVREITALPLIGMTLAGGDEAWSGRHWDIGNGTDIDITDAENVRVVGDQLVISWNDKLRPAPVEQTSQVRSVSSWGSATHADLVRRSVLVVGAGSIGLDIALRLATTGVTRIGVMDFDTVERKNLDRLIGATSTDAWLRRPKVHVARRLLEDNATAAALALHTWEHSVCEPAGFAEALDFDLIICCVDRPWARAVLNAVAYTDLIPVIDGGIAIDVFEDGSGMRNATWRSHVIRPGRPCMACNGQVEVGAVAADIEGVLDDAGYIRGAGIHADAGQNVSVLAISAAAALLAQYVSFNIAPGGMGEPGPLQYILSTHTVEHLKARSSEHCPYEQGEGAGDARRALTGTHAAADRRRIERDQLSGLARFARVADDLGQGLHRVLDRWSKAADAQSRGGAAWFFPRRLSRPRTPSDDRSDPRKAALCAIARSVDHPCSRRTGVSNVTV